MDKDLYFICKKCNHDNAPCHVEYKKIKRNAYNNYGFMLKAVCENCGAYHKFVAQNNEEALNIANPQIAKSFYENNESS